MDYVLGGVAALITGNVTPNRPKLSKRALTPTKHQPSPNVTPKSQLVDDRSIFLSPSVQKKKAIVKKSPKRIFENPDLNETNENEVKSPKADKVKKHLKDELNADNSLNSTKDSTKSPKKRRNKSVESTPDETSNNSVKMNEGTAPNNKRMKLDSTPDVSNDLEQKENVPSPTDTTKSPKKLKNKQKKNTDAVQNKKNEKSSPEKNTVNDEKSKDDTTTEENKEDDKPITKKKNKKRKKKAKQTQESQENISESTEDQPDQETVNPNAITNEDTDSEHESDDEIESENEDNNKAVLDTGPAESSDEEEDLPNKKEVKEDKKEAEVTEDELKRTLFVGNVLFSAKCKKEIKKIFNKYGTIESVRIRTVPVKDARVTPKLAVIKNELHPDRTTVNVYVKFKDEDSVEKALVENNTVLNSNHLRVSRSDSTGASHDPRCSVFVGNIPFGLEDEGLRVKFENCGEIESVRIIRDKKTNAGKGFGYVNFTSKDGVELALALTEEDLTIKNRILRVKRCTQLTNKQMSRQPTEKKGNQVNKDNRSFNKPQGNFRGGFSRNDGNNRGNFGRNDGNKGNFGRNDGNKGNFGRSDGNKGNFGRSDGNKGNFGRNDGNKGNFGRNQGGFGRGGGNTGKQGGRGRSQGIASRNQGNFNKNQGNDQNNEAQAEGAYRRIMNKRKNEEGNTDGPPTKQPREKKPRKEFVGVTAEKKKKHKFDKGQKKKKVLSEILTK